MLQKLRAFLTKKPAKYMKLIYLITLERLEMFLAMISKTFKLFVPLKAVLSAEHENKNNKINP